jgi:2-keto-4-pentenoate hydratase/2-oxohepta-3-ene-1,7-dioic acid hydratase in catechol pathway
MAAKARRMGRYSSSMETNVSEPLRKPRRLGVGLAPDARGVPRVVAVLDDAFFAVAAIEAEGVHETSWRTLSNLGSEAFVAEAKRSPKAVGFSPIEPPTRFAPPFDLARAFKVLALGRSYRAHAIELGNAPLETPLVFAKWPECMIGSGVPARIPADAEGKMDHEAELALVVGEDAVDLREGEGLSKIAGYCVANDLTLRAVQTAAKKAGGPWLRAKNFPTSLPIGPWITPRSAVSHPDSLEIRCTVGGVVRQKERVGAMTWNVGRTIEELSRLWPLRRGDVVSTGTPAGVSGLAPGDVCEIEIGNDAISLGPLSTPVLRT